MDFSWFLRPLYEGRLEVIASQRQELERRIEEAERLIADHRARLANLHVEEADIKQTLREGKVSI